MKKRGNKIKAIIFDVGGVLALGENLVKIKGRYHRIGIHSYVSKKLGISLDQYFDSIDTTYALAIEGKISREKTLKIFSKNLQTSAKKLKKLYSKAYRKNFKQNKQLFKQAFKLKKLDHKIAVLSDQWYLSKDALMPEKLYKNFNGVIVSCETGIRKPNTKIYKLILKKLNLKPSETIFIDNQKWNLAPAKKLAMKTILFKDNKQLFENKTWKKLFRK